MTLNTFFVHQARQTVSHYQAPFVPVRYRLHSCNTTVGASNTTQPNFGQSLGLE